MGQRDTNVQLFDDHEGPCILAASLKCGGVGLNLTMAQRVVIVDPWWNWAIEQQAFGRVFRIGQEQKTSLFRVFAENTIDRRIYDMQEQKRQAIDTVMGAPGQEKAFWKPSLQEMLELFGMTRKDAVENEYIVAQDDPKGQSAALDDQSYLLWGEQH